MSDEHNKRAREALGGAARGLLGASYERAVGRIAGAIDVAADAERARIAARLLSEADGLGEQAECHARAVRSWPDDRPGVAVFVNRAAEHRFAAAVLRRVAADVVNPGAVDAAAVLRAEAAALTEGT